MCGFESKEGTLITTWTVNFRFLTFALRILNKILFTSVSIAVENATHKSLVALAFFSFLVSS